jgi:hypothetical protein
MVYRRQLELVDGEFEELKIPAQKWSEHEKQKQQQKILEEQANKPDDLLLRKCFSIRVKE